MSDVRFPVTTSFHPNRTNHRLKLTLPLHTPLLRSKSPLPLINQILHPFLPFILHILLKYLLCLGHGSFVENWVFLLSLVAGDGRCGEEVVDGAGGCGGGEGGAGVVEGLVEEVTTFIQLEVSLWRQEHLRSTCWGWIWLELSLAGGNVTGFVAPNASFNFLFDDRVVIREELILSKLILLLD